MVGFEFENCGNAMLKCEGKILGGVEKATCTRKNSFTEIKEFFNDKPVERIVSNEWELTFVMKITDKTPFLERDSFKSLELDLAKKKIIYTDCKVLEFSSVTQGSGAEAAGIRKGDVITKFDGKTVSTIQELKEKLQYYAAGEAVSITVQSPGEGGTYTEKELTITLSSAQSSEESQSTDNTQAAPEKENGTHKAMGYQN